MSADEDARSERRREQLAAIHQQLTDAVDQLATSDAWLHMLQVAARLPSAPLGTVDYYETVERTMGGAVTRTDLHLGRSSAGEIFLTSRQDGMIRILVPDSSRRR